jgi:hypothetical protein
MFQLIFSNKKIVQKSAPRKLSDLEIVDTIVEKAGSKSHFIDLTGQIEERILEYWV